MPTIEIHGHRPGSLEPLLDAIRSRVVRLEFARDIVVEAVPGEVWDLDGSPRPFVRVYTRHRSRADALRAVLLDLADIEVVYIEFHERTSHHGD